MYRISQVQADVLRGFFVYLYAKEHYNHRDPHCYGLLLDAYGVPWPVQNRMQEIAERRGVVWESFPKLLGKYGIIVDRSLPNMPPKLTDQVFTKREDTEIHIGYKVVSTKKGKYFSEKMQGDLCQEYKIGVEIVPKDPRLPFYIFTDLDHVIGAYGDLHYSTDRVVLRCEYKKSTIPAIEYRGDNDLSLQAMLAWYEQNKEYAIKLNPFVDYAVWLLPLCVEEINV